jgi:hypothetical protein
LLVRLIFSGQGSKQLLVRCASGGGWFLFG